MKYTKKPVTIDAIQFTGQPIEGMILSSAGAANLPADFREMLDEGINGKKFGAIKTLEGWHLVSEGDFVITGIQGEKYPCKPDIFAGSYDEGEGTNAGKTLHNSTASGARVNVKDIIFWGNGDTFLLISKASSKNEGWMKSTKAMQIDGVGCVVQVTTQQNDHVAEAVTFVPGVKIEEVKDGDTVIGRKLVVI